MVQVFFAGGDARWAVYEAPLRRALDAVLPEYVLGPDLDPALAEYVIYAPGAGCDDFTQFPRAKAVLGLWAGVEKIAPNPTLTQPLARMVDHGLTQGMVEYCLGHALRHHLGMDRYIHGLKGDWKQAPPPLASSRKVAVLGLGALGHAVAEALVQVGFDVHGWARRPREVAGISAHHGPEGLRAALGGAEIVILLLPQTAGTENTLNAETLALLAPGAAVINPGRGPLIDDEALLAALERGQVGHATLDVFRIEPLPPEHPFWHHPNVTVTPHIAAETRPETSAQVIAENIRRGEASEPLLHLVDRQAGY